MNPSSPANPSPADFTPDEMHTAMFNQLVTGHAQMALTFLGRLPNPQTGETDSPNTDAARLFIDQLEMLEVKTRGNLTASESKLLSQMLGMTRMAFVEAIDELEAKPAEGTVSDTKPESPSTTPAEASEPAPAAPEPESKPGAGDESKVKFSKKYG